MVMTPEDPEARRPGIGQGITVITAGFLPILAIASLFPAVPSMIWFRLSRLVYRLSRGSLVGLVKSAGQKLNANSNEFAPSVAEADAILAAFGYQDAEALLAA